MKHTPDSADVHRMIARALAALCTRIADSIAERAERVGGPAKVAMLEIADAIREAGS